MWPARCNIRSKQWQKPQAFAAGDGAGMWHMASKTDILAFSAGLTTISLMGQSSYVWPPA